MDEFDPILTADIYRSILQLGMENLQRYRVVESFDYLAIEIDHLHNIPKYIVADSLISHGYYYCGERDFYIQRLADIHVIDTDFLIRMYQPHWNALRDALLPHADAINSRDWPTKL